ncbi:hypothetical protein TNIN_91851 [Trichonephila inaurata madagascariensis]|uniref:Uncharacterized protein n=1 Tax=Trichonephila inaurata madagascariensis TaxID=2747483 RepID=A0A8X6WX05_9ARAC|nr:hypothetical protein TNIN_91851 [Trichonephila inaurata madagascariensis]
MLDGLPRNSPSFRPLIDPLILAGTTQVESNGFTPSARQISAFQHLSSHFGALTCTQGADGSRMCVDIQTHTQLLYGTKKG